MALGNMGFIADSNNNSLTSFRITLNLVIMHFKENISTKLIV